MSCDTDFAMNEAITAVDRVGQAIIDWAKTGQKLDSPYKDFFLCSFHEALLVAIGK